MTASCVAERRGGDTERYIDVGQRGSWVGECRWLQRPGRWRVWAHASLGGFGRDRFDRPRGSPRHSRELAKKEPIAAVIVLNVKAAEHGVVAGGMQRWRVRDWEMSAHLYEGGRWHQRTVRRKRQCDVALIRAVDPPSPPLRGKARSAPSRPASGSLREIWAPRPHCFADRSTPAMPACFCRAGRGRSASLFRVAERYTGWPQARTVHYLTLAPALQEAPFMSEGPCCATPVPYTRDTKEPS